MARTTSTSKRRRRRNGGAQSNLVRRTIADGGFDLALTDESVEGIARQGFRGENLSLALVATNILIDEKPITLRGLMYRVVSAGWLPSTDKKHYRRLGRVMTTLREAGLVPFDWLVDNVRSTLKPSSWAGVTEFVDTVRDAYRMDFWSRLPQYVHVICEKDAIAGTIAPVTEEYDVALSPIRGYVSLSFAHEIAATWNRIEKPINAVYLGDYDPSGFDLERDLIDKLYRYCRRPFSWERLGVNRDDFDDFNLLPLAVKTGTSKKRGDTRAAGFIREHGSACAELDALPATEIRRRVRQSIEKWIPPGEWERLQTVERLERETFNKALAPLANLKL